MITWLVWNFLTIAIHGSFGYELDPVLHLGHPGIHTLAGTLNSKADHSDLGKSKSINEQNKLKYLVDVFISSVYHAVNVRICLTCNLHVLE